MKKVCLILLLIIRMQGVHANDCPQRYRDKVFNHVKISFNINYGGLRRHIEGNSQWLLADLYEPKGDTASLRPLVFLVHGGGGLDLLDKQSPDIVELANDLARRGYLVVSPDYRVAKDIFVTNSTERFGHVLVSEIVDVNDAICFFMESVHSGNPYKIDTSRLFFGGVSQGAMITLQSIFVEDTVELTPQFRKIFNDVAAFDNRNLQEMLQNKFCGAHFLGAIPISGALIDTNFVKPKNTAFLLIHGTEDYTIPYMSGLPFNSTPTLPIIHGSGAIYNKIKNNGIDVELDVYPGLGHVPFTWLDDPLKVLEDFNIWNEPVLDSTKNHIAHFCYRLMGAPVTQCNQLTGINNHYLGETKIFPNPNNGTFSIQFVNERPYGQWQMQIYDVTGELVAEKKITTMNEVAITEQLSTGTYFIKIASKQNDDIEYYLSKFIVNK